MAHSSRRHFLGISFGAAGLALLAGCGVRPPWEQPRTPRIGFLADGTRQGRAFLVDGFLDGLREHGYVDGQNIQIEYRFSDDRADRLAGLAEELVALPVDLIVASGTPASIAARRATASIPIVMGSLAADPVATGLIESLARPGGNVTGLTSISAQLTQKRLQYLTEFVPRLTRVGVFNNPNNPTYGPVLEELEEAAPTLNVAIVRLDVGVPEDFEAAFANATAQGAGAMIVPADPLTTNRPKAVADLALRYRLPTMMERRQFVEAGGLLAFGADIADLYRRSAAYVDRILRGTRPGDLPMEQPTKFDLAVNKTTARTLGLAIPETILQAATQVVE